MPVAQVPLAPAALIVGCGFVGRFLAPKLVARGVRVFAVVRSEGSKQIAERLGAAAIQCDVTDAEALAASLAPMKHTGAIDVYYLVPPGPPAAGEGHAGARQVVIEGAKSVAEQLRRLPVRRVVVASSTAVYGEAHGELVDADSPARPGDERGELLLEGEETWRRSGLPLHIVRFAGLYGPGRIIGMQAVRGGAPIVGDPDAWLNLIHGDDAAELLVAMMIAAAPGATELGSDGSPVRRIEYYASLAKCLGVLPPRVLDPAAAAKHLGTIEARLPRATSKRCDNVITCQRTGWLPQYPHFLAGLRASFEVMREMKP